jgi:hypothetical protein
LLEVRLSAKVPLLRPFLLRKMNFIADVATGALSPGTNIATFIALNVVLLLVIFSLIVLLAFSLTANPALVPHVLVLIFLAIGLWALMIWLIGVVGVVTTDQQQGEQEKLAGAAEAAEVAEGVPDKGLKKHL